MPCFSPLIGEWAATDSAPYQQALADIEKLKHMIDAYLEMAGMCRPDGTRAELPGVRRADYAQPFDLGLVKGPLMHSLAQHCLCDGIGFYQLYELQSVMEDDDPYRAIAQTLATAMRAGCGARPYRKKDYQDLDCRKAPLDLRLEEPAQGPQVQSWTRSDSGPWRWLRLQPALGLPTDRSCPLLDSLMGPESLLGLKWSHLLFSLMTYLSHKPAARPRYEETVTLMTQALSGRPPVDQRVGGYSYAPKLAQSPLVGELRALQAERQVVVACSGHGADTRFQAYRPLCLQACRWLWNLCSPELSAPWTGNLPPTPYPAPLVWTQLAVAQRYSAEFKSTKKNEG